MELAPLSPVSLDALTALGSRDGLRDGALLKAKVEAMLSSTLARLDIEGQKVELTTTRPLPAGTTLTLKVQRQDGRLQFVAQMPAEDAPAAGRPAAPLPDQSGRGVIGNLTDPTRTPLEKFQAVTVGAMLAEADDPDAPWTQITHPQTEPEEAQQQQTPSGSTAQQTPKPQAGAPAQLASGEAAPGLRPHMASPGQTPGVARVPVDAEMAGDLASPEFPLAQTGAQQAEAEADTAPSRPPPPEAAVQHGARPQAQAAAHVAAGDAAPEPHARATLPSDVPASAQSHAAAGASAQPASQQPAAFAVDVPLFFPGNPMPLRLEVTRDDEPAAQDGEEPRPRSWSVRFDAEAGPLGMVHAAISLVEGHIGVQLLAERDDTAEQFRQNAAQLRMALQASDLQVDAVNIGQGRPAGQELDL